MRIALNAWFIDQPITGSGQYLTHLLAEYAARHTEHRYLLCGHTAQGRPNVLIGPELPPSPFEWQALRTPFDGHSQHMAKLWFEQVSFPRACRRWDAEVVHVPYWASPLLCRTPTVVTVHDLIPMLLPAYGGGRLGRLYIRLVALSARRAVRILTDSHASRRDIIEHLHIPPERVEAIPLAADNRFRPLQDPEVINKVRGKYALPPHYLLYLGGFDVRKNVPAILHAYSRLDVPGVHLVIAGRLPTRDSVFTPHPQRFAAELGISERVCFTGWVDAEDKSTLYSGAMAFIFPSHYEGFGLPPLEAMACGTPVIVSDRGSLPEVVGDGGLCVDPDDVEALAGAVTRLIGDFSLYERLRKAALAQAARFSWQRTAQATMAAYQRVLA